ncbi:MAG: F0F1 ATP synthase subunit A [candidate division SR1 bacterium]|nr:F0F1 ATP synthase subunit A [candidate division SR1 bacterium]
MLFILLYTLLRRKNPHNKFTNLVDTGIEGIIGFFQELGGDIPLKVIKFIVFIFIYILRCNVVGLVGDMFVLVIPNAHFYFRPVSTDVFFNITIAVVCVVRSVVYGFQKNGPHYIQKYIGYKGLGIVPKVTGIATFIGKIFDIIVGLFIGLIEMVGEVTKILSLSLRLLGNILAGMVLLGLIVFATTSFLKVPVLLPLVVVFFELFVGFLQAFVFSMLVLVYFKIAGESTH